MAPHPYQSTQKYDQAGTNPPSSFLFFVVAGSLAPMRTNGEAKTNNQSSNLDALRH